MSFGRIKSHIKARHKEITVDQYIKQYWQTLPLHKLCEVCKENIVYKYKTCSKECHSLLKIGLLKGKAKPEGFMNQQHRDNLSKSRLGKIVSKETGDKISQNSLGVSRNKGKQPMLGKKHSIKTKLKQSNSHKEYYKNNKEKFWNNFIQNKSNKLEKFVSYILDKNNIKYNFQFFLNKDGVCKSYDFKLKDTNILLETDGDYWHGGPSLDKHFYKLEEVKQNDLFKDQFAKNNGFMLLRFWESDIYKNPEIIIDKIKELT
jgi:very-short-patch-repair endonuclease